jgi:hypothetical protein
MQRRLPLLCLGRGVGTVLDDEPSEIHMAIDYTVAVVQRR